MRRILLGFLLGAAMVLVSLQMPHAPYRLLSAGSLQLRRREDPGALAQDFAALGRQGVLPVGAVYAGHSNVPVFGRQSFALHTVSRTRARITLEGPIKLDEEAHYREEAGCDGVCQYQVELSEATLNFLARYRTRIRSTTYHVAGDYAVLVVKPAIFPRISVRLDRINSS
jgi:hypothetical protein